MTTAIVRRLTPDDAEAGRALRIEGLKRHPEAFSRDLDQEEALTVEAWRERYGGSVWFGGFVGGELVGLLAFSRESSKKLAHTGTIGAMYVREAARGQGLADALIEAALAHAAGAVEQVMLTVNAENARAIKLYERHGFRPTGRALHALRVNGKDYDELMMQRPITTSD